MDVLLGLGIGTDTETDDRLDLMAEPYRVLADSFQVDDDAADPRYVYVSMDMHLKGESQNALLNARNAIIDKLNQATIGGTSVNEWVTLGVKLSDADTMVWWHVVEGGIPEPGVLRPQSSYIGHVGEPLRLMLRCHKGAFSEAVEDEAVAVGGDDPTLYRAGIPGNLPAYVEAVITDTSENSVVLHGIGVGSRSAKDMADADFEPFQSLAATGSGSLADETPDTFDGDCITTTPGINWSSFAVANPTEAQMQGRYDLWLRVKDDTPTLDTPLNVIATASQGPSMRQQKHTPTGTFSSTAIDPTIPGNTLFLDIYAAHNSSTPSVASVPSGFVLVESQTQSNMLSATYIYENAPVTEGSLSVTLNNAVKQVIVFEEWSGLVTPSSDVETSNGVASSTSHSTGTTGTTAQAASLVRTMHIVTDDMEPDSYTAGYTRSFRGETELSFSPFLNRRRLYSYYRILSSTGTQSAGFTTEEAEASANLIAVYKAQSAGSLTADTYHYRIAAMDSQGRLSRASTTTAIYHASSSSATQLEWQASIAPGVDDYRVFIRKGTGTWVYFDVGGTTPAFLHTTMSGPDGTADPPDTGLQPNRLRLGFALGSAGDVLHRTDARSPVRSNGIWEWVRFGTVDLPTVALPPGITQPSYRVVAEATGAGGNELCADVLAFIPADEAFFDASADDLDSVREWVMGTNAAGQRFAWVRDPNDATDASGAASEGTFAVGPGDTKLLFIFRSADGQSVVDDVSADVQLTFYPRWRWLAGEL